MRDLASPNGKHSGNGSHKPSIVKTYNDVDEVWPPGPGWGYHWADLDILRIHNYEVFGD
jgi:hypothetical protein